jgi:hypothetical protein
MALFRRRPRRQKSPPLHSYRGEGTLDGPPGIEAGSRPGELLMTFQVDTRRWGLLAIQIAIEPGAELPQQTFALIGAINSVTPLEEWRKDEHNSPKAWVEAAYFRGLAIYAQLMRSSAQYRRLVDEVLASQAIGATADEPARV